MVLLPIGAFAVDLATNLKIYGFTDRKNNYNRPLSNSKTHGHGELVTVGHTAVGGRGAE